MNLQEYYATYGNAYGIAALNGVIFLLIVWSLVWKGLALWRAARNGSRIWFVAIMLINTLGILEILYLFVFGKPKAPPVIQ